VKRGSGEHGPLHEIAIQGRHDPPSFPFFFGNFSLPPTTTPKSLRPLDAGRPSLREGRKVEPHSGQDAERRAAPHSECCHLLPSNLGTGVEFLGNAAFRPPPQTRPLPFDNESTRDVINERYMSTEIVASPMPFGNESTRDSEGFNSLGPRMANRIQVGRSKKCASARQASPQKTTFTL
jgi:hypothetical protein